MPTARAGRRHVVGFGVMLAWLLAWCPGAFALNPALDVSQYVHTAWRIRDGFSKGTINSIAQTPDGYLWLGTEVGMLRFDGMRPVPWQPPSGPSLPSSNIQTLLTTKDGVLWIGTDLGLAWWKDGKLTRYEPLGGRFIGSLVEDHEGTIWATTFFNLKWTLCEIRRATAECHGDDGGPGVGAISVYEDRSGRLWAGTVGSANGLWQWKPGAPKFYPLPQQANGIRGLAEDGDGVLLVSLAGAVGRFVDEKMQIAFRFPTALRHLSFPTMVNDRDGGLWLGGSNGGGLVHVRGGRTDVFAPPDGLSGDSVYGLFEDREGNVWAASTGGLDRFRDSAVVTYSVQQGLASAFVGSVFAARDGSIWIGTSVGLNHWRHGQEISRWQPARAASVQSIFQDSLERMWVSTPNDIGYFRDNRFAPMEGVGGGLIRWIAEDADANLWIASTNRGLFRVSIRTGEIDLTRWDRLNRGATAVAMATDSSLKGVWLGFRQDGLVYFADGQVRASFGIADGIAAGLRSLHLDSDGVLWVATDNGLSRVQNGRVATLTSKNGLPCDGIEWLVEDDDRALWLGTRCGLVRIAHADLAGWIPSLDSSAHEPKGAIKTTVFDVTDGVRTYIGASYFSRPAAKGSDGRLWFISQGGLSVVDPHSLAFNSLPPPVHIEQIIADRTPYDADALARGDGRLPPLTRDLQIDYTALSLVAPEKMRFRYQLEGRDRDWQDAGNRRQAFYSDLPPGNYRFRVMASNNSGVWNETGATLNFAVAPAYYQTAWFRVLVIGAFLGLLAALYRLRVRQVALQYNARLEARVSERTRIARDLHDTLLQSFQGVLLKFYAATYLLPDRPEEAKKTLEGVIDQARNAITEGRDAVQGLRAAATVTNDLPGVIRTFAEDLAASHEATEVQLHVEGMPRDLAALIQDDVYRIACEALRNAFSHADARHVEVEIHYDQRQLRLRIRDDGKGIESNILRAGGRPRHYGLKGMHERAAVVGGKLTVWSEVDAGTEIELTVPASVAYAPAMPSPSPLVPEQT
jgi:signal transduction histidine kinase/ligand-binding sensor domain-containing protein